MYENIRFLNLKSEGTQIPNNHYDYFQIFIGKRRSNYLLHDWAWTPEWEPVVYTTVNAHCSVILEYIYRQNITFDTRSTFNVRHCKMLNLYG